MKKITKNLKWYMLVITIIVSTYFMLLAFQNAWISATPVENADYYINISKKYFYSSIFIFIIGIIIFIGIHYFKSSKKIN